MKSRFVVANWKSHKTKAEALEWFQSISNFKFQISNSRIILCPPFTLLSELKLQITNYHLPFILGAQDISPFEEGAYTGEVNGKQITEFAEYVIVGHSERRKFFKEELETIHHKIVQAVKNSLKPILCVSEMNQLEGISVDTSELIVAYEPLFAIGSGNPDTPENAHHMAQQIKEKMRGVPVLYGGSVTSQNARSFLTTPDIDGVLVGGASLNPSEFATILSHA